MFFIPVATYKELNVRETFQQIHVILSTKMICRFYTVNITTLLNHHSIERSTIWHCQLHEIDKGIKFWVNFTNHYM